MLSFDLYTRRTYFKSLVAKVRAVQPGGRVVVATMGWKPTEEPMVMDILDALCDAASRDVRVHLLVDAYAFLVSERAVPGPLFFGPRPAGSRPGVYRSRFATLERLKAAGGRYTITNVPDKRFSVPYAGRSHIKYAVIDSYVYAGGCNLTMAANSDCMVGWDDSDTADWLLRFAENVRTTGSSLKGLGGQDVTRPLDDMTAMLVDAGVAGRSVIYDQALRLIDTAKHFVTITCQYFPNDVTADHLAAAARRGLRVEVIYNHPAIHVFPHTILHRSVEYAERLALPKELVRRRLTTKHDYMHAKVLATDQGTLVGSHNYVAVGVRMGTAEIALLSRDPAFGVHVRNMIEAQIA